VWLGAAHFAENPRAYVGIAATQAAAAAAAEMAVVGEAPGCLHLCVPSQRY